MKIVKKISKVSWERKTEIKTLARIEAQRKQIIDVLTYELESFRKTQLKLSKELNH